MVTVGPERGCTAQLIAGSTRMHKTRVSRAIAHLMKRGLIERLPRTGDRRSMELLLTRRGRGMYQDSFPWLSSVSARLLACLTRAELRGFLTGLTRLESFLGLQSGAAADLLT